MAVSISELRQDHVKFNLILNMMERQVAALDSERKSVALKLIQLGLKYFRDYPRKFHHPKEDAIYGLLLRKHFRKPELLYNVIEDHSELRDSLKALSDAAAALNLRDGEAVTAICDEIRKFIASERHHIDMEEGHLYSTAVQQFTPEDWQSVSDAFGDEADPIFGDEIAAKFDRLIATVLMQESRWRNLDMADEHAEGVALADRA